MPKLKALSESEGEAPGEGGIPAITGIDAGAGKYPQSHSNGGAGQPGKENAGHALCVRDGNARAQRFEFQISLAGSPRTWAAAISGAGFSDAKIVQNSLVLGSVQSLDLQSRPHEFVQITLSKNRLEAEYSILAHQNPLRRKLYAAHLSLLALACAGGCGAGTPLCAFLSSCLEESASFVSLETDPLVSKNSELEARFREQSIRLKELYEQREENSRKMISDAKRLAELEAKISALERVPDAALDEDVLEWLKTHGGLLSLREFSLAQGIPPSRVEQSLDRLCKRGKIARLEK